MNLGIIKGALYRAALTPILFFSQLTAAETVDQDCVVNILNRTVQVQSGGEWAMPNVPSSMGQIRARVTCVREGKTTFGQTDYFTASDNITITASDFYFGENDPTPARLEFLPSGQAELTDTDVSLQLSLVATYSDSTSEEVTDTFFGTNYLSSNPAVASIDENGLVTSHKSGNVIITARKDGVVAFKSISVIVSGDSDGDGLPDDYELEQGLDPNDPLDALEDQDEDGLSTLDEYNLGTEPLIRDSDLDGIDDGEEVIAGEDGYITNPLLKDTDGDKLPDGLEVTLQSDPLDPNDANYQDAILGISISPRNSVLSYNTIDGESSLQLTVTGQLVGGEEIDVTSTSMGTNYTSSDLSIVSFGVTSGRVFAGQEGTATITAEINGHTASASIKVRAFSPVVRSFIDLDFKPYNVKVLGDYGYIAAGSDGLVVVNMENPDSPHVVSKLILGGTAKDIQLSGTVAYVTTGVGLSLIDISTPTKPKLLSSAPTVGQAQDVSLSGDHAFVADGNNGLLIIDVTDVTAPVVSGTLITGGEVTGVGVDGTTAALTIGQGTLMTVDVSDVTNPVEKASLEVVTLDNTDLTISDVVVRGDYAYVAANRTGYRIIDISDPASPINAAGSASSNTAEFAPTDLVLTDSHAFFADRIWVSAIPYVNVSKPLNPVFQGAVDMSENGDYDCVGVDADSTYVYCVASKSYYSRLYLVQYRAIDDTMEIAPTVNLNIPRPGSVLSAGRPYKFNASAHDDYEMASVAFTVNGEMLHADTSEPYEFIYTVPESVEGISVQVDAYDLAGNVGSTGTIVFDVSDSEFLYEVWDGGSIIEDPNTEERVASEITMMRANYSSTAVLATVGDFYVVGGGTSSINVAGLTVGNNLVVDGATLVVDSESPLTVYGDLIITNGGKLTVPDANKSAKTYITLALNVTGKVIVDGGASIDVTGKGYPGSYYSGPDYSYKSRYGCHGGKRSSAGNDCTYGDYKLAKYPGSAGYYFKSNAKGHGGGVISITAAAVELNGMIVADGLKGNEYIGGGAGGSIHITADSVSGSGNLSVRGAGYAYSSSTSNTAGGGRISLYIDNTADFSGNYLTGANSSGRVSGAGTVYLKNSSQRYGHLISDNGGKLSPSKGTPIRQVGRHPIVSSTHLGGTLWEVKVDGTPWKPTDEVLSWGIQGDTVVFDAENKSAKRYTVVSNTENTLRIETNDDLSSIVGNELVGIHVFETLQLSGGVWLDFGDDWFEVLQIPASTISSGSRITAGSFPPGMIEKILGDGGSVVSTKPITLPEIDAKGSTVTQVFAPKLTVLNNIKLDGQGLELNIDEPLEVGGDVVLTNGAVITVGAPGTTSQTFNSLDIAVGGDVIVDATSLIDVSEKGYPHNFKSPGPYQAGCHGGIHAEAGPKCSYGHYVRAKYAGSSGNYYNENDNGNGGGLIRIQATNMVLDGGIKANASGGRVNYKQPEKPAGGAGGGIDLQLVNLSGNGFIQAHGGRSISSSEPAGAGGRISVLADDVSGFTGTASASSGISGLPAGAGTAYFKERHQQYGSLIVDNSGVVAQPYSTPMRNVGRHTIVDVYMARPDEWVVSVSGSPWNSSDSDPEGGLIGIGVDFDAGDNTSPHYEIVANTNNSLTVKTSDNLRGILANDLVGIHTFKELHVGPGADVSFGDDRVVILDVPNSTLAGTLRIHDKSQLLSLIDSVVAHGGKLVVESHVSLDTLTVSAGSIEFKEGLSISGELRIAGSARIIALNLDAASIAIDTGATLLTEGVGVDADIRVTNGAVLTVPYATQEPDKVYALNIQAGGNITVDESSRIDLDGKGYSGNMKVSESIPNSQGCYGGISSSATTDCTYGRYQKATFAGKGTYNTSFGGGAVRLQATALQLDGALSANAVSTGAGGGIDINVATLTGMGLIEANGDYGGSGGRISLYASDRSGFSGTVHAQSEMGRYSISGSAGTIFIQDTAQPYGNLAINNGGYASPQSGTPIRSVGRHTITAVYQLQPDLWEVLVAEEPWQKSDHNNAFGLDGIEVDLDTNDELSAHYTIVENSRSSITLQTIDDLSAVVGNELVGVHHFQTLNIEDGADVDFGGDRIILHDLVNSSLSAKLRGVEVNQSLQSILSAGGGELTSAGPINITSIDLESGILIADAVDTESVLLKNSSQLISETVFVSSDMSLQSGSSLTVPVANADDKKIHKLNLSVGGELTIDATSAIDLDGRGYPEGWSGPDFSQKTGQQCHGGTNTNSPGDCSYGRYTQAKYAGSGGYDGYSGSNGYGGGAADISALSLVLDGEIRANAITSNGAGGSIHLDAATLSGSGKILTNGSSYSGYGSGKGDGAGGRISVYVDDGTGFSGTIQSMSGRGYTTSGAGTVFIKPRDLNYGELVVDNGGDNSPPLSTPIRSVGRHTITHAGQVSAGIWAISVTGVPWKPSGSEHGWGLDGIEVDLDASDTNGPLYTIISNTSNTLTLHTSDDISHVVGQDLVGVHTFQRLQVLAGADIDFGDDRVEILDTTTSRIEGTLRVASPSASLQQLMSHTSGTIAFSDPVTFDSLEYTNGHFEFNGGLSVTGDLLLNNTKLTASTIEVGAELHLRTGSVITVADASMDTKTVNKLDLTVDGLLSIDATSMIDLDGKGYPSYPNRLSNNWSGPDFTDGTRIGCHGGILSTSGTDCSFGRYEDVRQAGSSGAAHSDTDEADGGGVARIYSDRLELNGVIRANGENKPYYTAYGSAGGGINITARSLSGSGAIEANGGRIGHSSYPAGAGGRISILVDDRSNFSGSMSATTGNYGTPGGAGTIYVKEAGQAYGHLIVDNGGRAAKAGSTPIRNIGKHLISAVELTAPGIWRITVSGTPWKESDTEFGWGVDGINVDLDASEAESNDYRVVENGPNTLTIHTTDDLSSVVGNTLQGIHRFNTYSNQNGGSASFGEDRVVVVGDMPILPDYDQDGLSNDDERNIYGTDPFNADSDEDHISDYLEVQLGTLPLDPTSGDITAYTTGLIMSPSTLSIELNGIHDPSSVTVMATVEYNGEIYLVDITSNGATSYTSSNSGIAISLGDGQVDAVSVGTAELRAQFAGFESVGLIEVAALSSLEWSGEQSLTSNMIVQNATLVQSQISGDYTFKTYGNLVVQGGSTSIMIDTLQVNGDLIIDGVTLTAGLNTPLSIGGNLQLKNGAKLTVPVADATTKRVYSLELDVAGNVSIDTTSSIDASGRGYPYQNSIYWSGPDFSENTRKGCHAGNTHDDVVCAYGDYRYPRFAGSAGRYAGGGVIMLTAQALQLNGAIRVNGFDNGYYGAAGGSVLVDIAQLSGTGVIEANGGRASSYKSNYRAGSGGRIAIHTDDRSGFIGTVSASSGNNGYRGSAGTIYIKESTQSHGHLIVKNAGRSSPKMGTPIRSVGRHTIASIMEIEPDLWQVEVVGAPWQVSDTALGWGLSGIEVDLQADVPLSPTYRIESNTENTLTISTTDDLSAVLGNELIGVHTFQTLTVDIDSEVSFGEDRVIVNDEANSQINGVIYAGEASISAVQASINGSWVLSGKPTYDSLTLTGAKIRFTDTLTVTGELLLSGGELQAKSVTAGSLLLRNAAKLSVESAVIEGNLSMYSGSLIKLPSSKDSYQVPYHLDLSVGGTLHIDRYSAIDVSDLWYVYNTTDPYFGSRKDCHGGLAAESSSDCSYGRFEWARFPGGDAGVVQINSGALALYGEIRANGSNESAGSIHLETGTLSGYGKFQANSGGKIYDHEYGGSWNATTDSGAGRISIYVDDRSAFTGSYSAQNYKPYYGNPGGDGTIYIQDTGQLYGHLVIGSKTVGTLTDNAMERGTPIRRVGRHVITDAIEIQPGMWRLNIASDAWTPTNTDLGLGIDGIEVDLAPNDPASQFYRIVSNTENSIVISTSDDLSGSIGNELVGVHTFQTLTVSGDSDVDFGEDRLVVLDIPGSSVAGIVRAGEVAESALHLAADGGGRLMISQLPVSAADSLVIENLGSGNLEIAEPVSLANLTIKTGSVRFNTGLEVSSNLTITDGAQVSVAGVIHIGGDMALSINSTLTTPPGITRPEAQVNALNLNVAGTLTIDATSAIDLSGKGYRFTSGICTSGHGGKPHGYSYYLKDGCAYGRYERARFAGSSGAITSINHTVEPHGGGLAKIRAHSMVLDGVVRANGSGGDTTHNYAFSGAGGGIDVETVILSGSGSFEALGGFMGSGKTFYWGGEFGGAGGRISIRVTDRTDFSGSWSAAAGGTGETSGAGTVYVKDAAQEYGHLVVDNAGHSTLEGSTPLRSVGRHTIDGVYHESDGIWRIIVDGTPWESTDPLTDKGVDGLMVDLDTDDPLSPHYQIVVNTSNTLTLHTTDDLSGLIGNEIRGVHHFQTLNIGQGVDLDAGGDVIVIHDTVNSQLAGTLRLDELNASLLQLTANGGGRLVVNRAPDIGTLTLSGISEGTLEIKEAISLESLHLNGMTMQIANEVQVIGELKLEQGAALNSTSLQTGSIVMLDSSKLNSTVIHATQITANDLSVITGETLKVTGDFTLLTGSSLTVPEAITTPERKLYKLSLDVGGALDIDSTSFIDLDGKGYPYQYVGPDFSSTVGLGNTAAKRRGCHGGTVNGLVGDCTFGHYTRANFAGSSGSSYGGGMASISANTVTLDGAIHANASNIHVVSNLPAAAGGGIHIDTGLLQGNGRIEVNGAKARYETRSSGAGGRISLYYQTQGTHIPSLSASAGNYGLTAGAGTIYVWDKDEQYGELTVNNGDRLALPGSTPIRHIGRHVITSVNETSPDVWSITASGANWKASDVTLDWGLDGIKVDLDASEEQSPHYTVISNTVDTLVVRSGEDLTSVLGNELVGVHTFQDIHVGGGAFVDFGGDRVIDLTP